MRSLFVLLTRNPISLLGTAVTSASAVMIATLFAIELVGFLGNPYIGILAYLILPAFFLLGLLLIPIGIAWERRRARVAAEQGEPPPRFPVVDLNTDRTRRLVLLFFVLTLANLVILAAATYKGVEVMDSTEFCGTTCHTVMQPEHTAYLRSPHSRVKCVSCHIGPGADWFVKAKLSGAWQVVSATFELYPRPIPTPVENLRPARETCEQCHWPTKFVGDRLEVLTRYMEDEASTETKTVLLLRVGGIQGPRSQGIHWHVDPANRIRYRADAKRETMYEIELATADGQVKTFLGPDPPADVEAVPEEWRTMDCIDCHNRPTHVYRSAEAELDWALETDRLPAELPFIRREGYRAIVADYPSHEEARAGIAETIATYYRVQQPEIAASARDSVERAGRVLGDLYCANVFPAMNVTWGTYPDHIGHSSSPGCFRCHDGEHATADGQTISQDCDTCHTVLALEEENPEILATLRP